MSERTSAENKAAMAEHLIGQYRARVASELAAPSGWAAGRCVKCGLENDRLRFLRATGQPCKEADCPVGMNAKRPNSGLSGVQTNSAP